MLFLDSLEYSFVGTVGVDAGEEIMDHLDCFLTELAEIVERVGLGWGWGEVGVHLTVVVIHIIYVILISAFFFGCLIVISFKQLNIIIIYH
jgi:hypothetical protein